MKPIITLQNASVVYNEGETAETTALKNVSLEIFEGEYIVFFGPSGCGKSTLLYTIAGLEAPTAGSVTVAGHDLHTTFGKELIEFYRSTIGMVFQAFYLVPHLTARDNMILSKMFAGVPKAERERKADELCDRFGITAFADRKPSMMSGGQQQRTAIGRALMNDPRIILADEPVGNLDSKNAEIVLELLADIHRKEKKTVIQVTHNPKDVHYADRVFYMKDGMVERVVVQKQPTEQKPVSTPLSAVKELKAPAVTSHIPEKKIELRNPTHVILQGLVSSYSGHLTPEQTERIRICIEESARGNLSLEELRMRLDVPFKDGGVGLNSHTARHFADTIIMMLS